MIKFSIRHLKILVILFLPINISLGAKLQNFETTRLKSTAGAGVGSILMDEATILNPAPIAFYNIGSIYLSKGTAEFSGQGSSADDSDQLGVIVSDAKGNTAGSLSYHKQDIGNLKRKRISAAISSPIKKKSAMGISLRKTTDTLIDGSEDDYLQTTVGVIHALSDEFTLGVIAVDPLKERKSDSKGIVGIQYLYKDFISLMVDAGANYYDKIGETFLYKGAVQFKILDDFYARFGYSRDLGLEETGTGVGIGWVQPRLVIEAALKNIESDISSEEVSESSFSLSYRF